MTLTLTRPDKLNAIDNEVAADLLRALDATGTNEAVRAIRLCGEGAIGHKRLLTNDWFRNVEWERCFGEPGPNKRRAQRASYCAK